MEIEIEMMMEIEMKGRRATAEEKGDKEFLIRH